MTRTTHARCCFPVAGVAASLFVVGGLARPVAAQQPAPAPVTPVAPAPAPVGTPPAGPAPLPATLLPPDALISVPADYRLHIGDVVRVSVLRHIEVNATVAVPIDGKLRLERLKEPVDARGKTLPELADALARGWSHQFRLKPGQVNVAVTAMRKRRIFMQGNAGGNGELDLQPGWRIAHLLGGQRSPERLTVTITNPARSAPVSVDLSEAISSPASEANVPLLENDTITVQVPRTIRMLVTGVGPLGEHEIDYRYGLRRALGTLKYTTKDAAGSLRDVRILRKERPDDLDSPDRIIPVNLYALLDKPDTPDIPLRDQDVLHIPASERWVVLLGEVNGRGLMYLPENEDEITLQDVMSRSGGPLTGRSSIGKIGIRRVVDGKPVVFTVDYGKYLNFNDPKGNPEILPHDEIFVPPIARRTDDAISGFFRGFSLWSFFKGVF